jgi:phosphate transport system permease protein
VSIASSDWEIATPRFRRRLAFDRWVGRLLPFLTLVVLIPLLDLIYWVAQKALPTLTWVTLTTNPQGLGGGLWAPITGTLDLLAISTAFATGVGVFGGMFTAEFASPRLAAIARMGANVLAGTPAMVVGYFGFFAFVLYTHSYGSLWAGGITLGVFLVPYVYRAADLGFSQVPAEQREAALGAGATPREYLFRVGLPIALPRILTGVFLAMAIGVGETAPLLFTAGWQFTPAGSPLDQTSYLTGMVWTYFDFPSTEGSFQALAFQAAFLLIVLVIALNIAIQLVSERSRRRLRGLYR